MFVTRARSASATHDDQQPERDGEARDGAERPQRARRAGRRDHFRRRRFARGERRRERIAARERRRDRQRGRRTLRGIRFQAAHDRAIDRRIEIAHDLGRLRDAVLLALGDELRQVASFERAAPGEELVEDEAERVDVAARRDFAAGELLGRHVGGRAGAQRFAGRSRQAEIGDADPAVAVEHDVGGLQIAMDDAAIVRRGQARAHLPRDLDRAVLRKAADAAEQRRQILAVDVLHRQERVTLELADVVDAAHVGVRHLPRHPDFGVELHQPRGIPVDLFGQELQRDRLAELEIVGPVDFAHPALAQAPDDAVAAVEERARREAAVVDRVGAGQPAAALRRRLRAAPYARESR